MQSNKNNFCSTNLKKYMPLILNNSPTKGGHGQLVYNFVTVLQHSYMTCFVGDKKFELGVQRFYNFIFYNKSHMALYSDK